MDSRLEHVDFESLLQCLSVTRLLQVFASLLLERRVIFIADKLRYRPSPMLTPKYSNLNASQNSIQTKLCLSTTSVLSRCAHSALALLYPFTWQHTFVPVLPASMLDICCSPTPFVMGVLSPSLPEVQDMPIEEVSHFEFFPPKLVVIKFFVII